MLNRVILSLLIITGTIVAISGAALAYFSDNAVLGTNTFTMGTVKLNSAWTSNLPVKFDKMTPGKTSSSSVIGIGYGGSIEADLYVGMKDTGNVNLLSALDYYIEEVTDKGDHIANISSWDEIGSIFGSWKKIASKVSQNQWKYFKIHVRVHADAGNEFQGKTATDDIIIYAVQSGQPSPTQAPYLYSPTQNP